MAKRLAGSVLNHDNWNDDDDDDEEGGGTFKVANADVLKGREIMKARRRKVAPASGGDNSTSGNAATGSSGAFKSFSFGLSATTNAATKDKLFSFLPSVATVSSSSVENGVQSDKTIIASVAKSASVTETSAASGVAPQEERAAGDARSQQNVSLNNDMKGSTDMICDDATQKHEQKNFNSEYAESLRALNKSVVDWIVQHVDENPYCILSPIFVDYNHYVAELDEKKNKKSDRLSDSSSSTICANLPNNGSSVSLGSRSITGQSIFSSAGLSSCSTSGLSTCSSASLSTSASFGLSSCGSAPASDAFRFSASTSGTAPQPFATGPASTLLGSGVMASLTTSTTSPLTFGSSAPPLSMFSFMAKSSSPNTLGAGKTTTSLSPLGGFTATSSANSSSPAGLFQSSASSSLFPSVAASKPMFSFGATATPTATFGATSAPSATFGSPSAPIATFGAPSSTAFGAGFFTQNTAASTMTSNIFTATTTTASVGFSFASKMGSGFQFGSLASTAGTSASTTLPVAGGSGAGGSAAGDTGNDDEGAEYQPPKPEVVEHTEEGAFHTVRCKLFYMKNNSWVDRGLGNLHLKKFNDTKTQLIVRADTALGNILLNIMLTEGTPVKLMDATRVSILCVPNPPIDEKKPSSDPIVMLVKVKTAEQATELLKQISDSKST